MAARCAFCNQSICFGEETYNGKVYHPKCSPANRPVDPDAPTVTVSGQVPPERMREFEQGPKVLGTIEFREKGIKVDPRSGNVTPMEGAFANPRVGRKTPQQK
eukprot:m51a1_g3225 hypothetical protein (103) ;mRNA; r:87017-87469